MYTVFFLPRRLPKDLLRGLLDPELPISVLCRRTSTTGVYDSSNPSQMLPYLDTFFVRVNLPPAPLKTLYRCLRRPFYLILVRHTPESS